MLPKSSFIGLLLGLWLLPAGAQESVRIRGTVAGLDGQTLTVNSGDGRATALTVPSDTRIIALVNKTLSEIKTGDFVGSAAIRGTDGLLHAQEVHVFPENMRGTGEGHRPMAGPERSMTNATVAEVASAPQGRLLKLKYAGGEQTIEVGPTVRIVGFVPGDRGLLQPGATVLVVATKQSDGGLIARFVQAEKDGVPPLD